MSYADPFPNSEQLFREAFSQPNPKLELLKLIAEHPTYWAVRGMLIEYTFVVEETPSRAEALASMLLALRDSPDAPEITHTNLREIFGSELADLHSRGLHFDDDHTTLGPTNTFLSNSLLSGLSLKHKLTSCSDQHGAILDGLDVKANAPGAEVLVTGTCIQLLIAGSDIMQSPPSTFRSANEVTTKLKAQKSAGIAKNPNALKLLELTIAHAESRFRKENGVDNVWQILFPTQV